MRKYFYLAKGTYKSCFSYSRVYASLPLFANHYYNFILGNCSSIILIKLSKSKPLTSISEVNAINKFEALDYLIYNTRMQRANSTVCSPSEDLHGILIQDILKNKSDGKLVNEHYFSMGIATIVSLVSIGVTWASFHLIFGALPTVLFLLTASIGSLVMLYNTIQYENPI